MSSNHHMICSFEDQCPESCWTVIEHVERDKKSNFIISFCHTLVYILVVDREKGDGVI